MIWLVQVSNESVFGLIAQGSIMHMKPEITLTFWQIVVSLRPEFLEASILLSLETSVYEHGKNY